MASAATIRRLHAAEPDDRRGKDQVDAINLKPPRSRFRGFRLTASPEANYTLDPAAIMGIMQPAAPLDRSFQFQELALRERLERNIRRHLAARGMHF
jgi:hypothetical protein